MGPTCPPCSFALAFIDAAGEIRPRQARHFSTSPPVNGALPARLGLSSQHPPLLPCRCDWSARLLLSGAHQRQHWGCDRDACHPHWPPDPSAGAASGLRRAQSQKQHPLTLACWTVQSRCANQSCATKMCPVDAHTLFVPSCYAAEAPPALPPPPAGPQPPTTAYNASFYIVYNATGNLPIACASFNASTGQWEQSTNPTQYGAPPRDKLHQLQLHSTKVSMHVVSRNMRRRVVFTRMKSLCLPNLPALAQMPTAQLPRPLRLSSSCRRSFASSPPRQVHSWQWPSPLAGSRPRTGLRRCCLWAVLRQLERRCRPPTTSFRTIPPACRWCRSEGPWVLHRAHSGCFLQCSASLHGQRWPAKQAEPMCAHSAATCIRQGLHRWTSLAPFTNACLQLLLPAGGGRRCSRHALLRLPGSHPCKRSSRAGAHNVECFAALLRRCYSSHPLTPAYCRLPVPLLLCRPSEPCETCLLLLACPLCVQYDFHSGKAVAGPGVPPPPAMAAPPSGEAPAGRSLCFGWCATSAAWQPAPRDLCRVCIAEIALHTAQASKSYCAGDPPCSPTAVVTVVPPPPSPLPVAPTTSANASVHMYVLRPGARALSSWLQTSSACGTEAQRAANSMSRRVVLQVPVRLSNV